MVAAAIFPLIGSGVSAAVGTGSASASSESGIHVVNTADGVSFYAPAGYTRVRGVPSYLLVELRDMSTSAQLTIENPNGKVSIQDGRNYLKSWVGRDGLKITRASTLHERFGEVAALRFTFTFPGARFVEYGEDSRFLSGARSYDIVVDAPGASSVSTTTTQVLSSWGR
jgi:hypothetical protein